MDVQRLHLDDIAGSHKPVVTKNDIFKNRERAIKGSVFGSDDTNGFKCYTALMEQLQ